MLLDDLKRLRVIKADGSFNTRMGMSLSRNPKHAQIWKEVRDRTDFLGTVSNAQRFHAIANNIYDPVLCPNCRTNNLKFVSFNRGYQSFCSPKCAQSDSGTRHKIEQTNIDRYGSKYPCGNRDINRKRQATCETKYGAPTPFESQEIQHNIRDTIKKQYGVTSTAVVPDVVERQKQTRLERIGVEYPFQSADIQKKVNRSCTDKLGDIRYSKSLVPDQSILLLEDKKWLHLHHVMLEKPLTQIGQELGVSDVTVGNYLKSHGITTHHFSHSAGEKEILAFIQQHPDTTAVGNVRHIIQPYELDIFVPTHNLAIEYCGLYWHSDKFRTPNYHRDKLKACQQHGIRLLTIFEDEWLLKRHIVKSKIKNILGLNTAPVVYARKTNVVKLHRAAKAMFLNAHHIQGTGSGSITYGLEYDHNIVAVMTFIRKSNQYELNRYATSCRVVGGFSKLLSHFQRHHEWSKIVSFADLRWSEGNLYKSTGWLLEKCLPPDYYWTKSGRRWHKFNFRHKLAGSRLEVYDDNLSEAENCRNNGYTKIYNCGLLKYSLTNPDLQVNI